MPDMGDLHFIATSTPDFADREAASIIDLCRSLANSPGDLHGLIAARLRTIRAEGRTEGAITSLVTAVSQSTQHGAKQ